MAVLVIGAHQARDVAGYVAAVTGRAVHLSAGVDQSPIHRVHLDGHDVKVTVTTDSLPASTPEATILVTESRNLRQAISPFRDFLSGTPVLLAPGGFAGALRVRAWFEEWGLEPPLAAEATGFPVSGVLRDGTLRVRTVKHRLPLASFSPGETAYLHGVFSPLLPQVTAADLATTSLSNTNHMIHPGVVLLNAARVENGEPFSFYRSGLSPAAGRLIEAIDAERVEIARHAGAQSLSVRDWMARFYGAAGMGGGDILTCLKTFAEFEHVPSPPSLNYRYLADDVPHGVAQWSFLAQQRGLSTPHIDALVTLLRHLAPSVPIEADVQGARLFGHHLSTVQGVTA